MVRPLPRRLLPPVSVVFFAAGQRLTFAAAAAPPATAAGSAAAPVASQAGVVDVALSVGGPPPSLGMQQSAVVADAFSAEAAERTRHHLMRRQDLPRSGSSLADAGVKPCGMLLEGELAAGKPCSDDGPQADDPFKEEEDSAVEDIVDGGEPAQTENPNSTLFWLEYGCRAEQTQLNTVAGGVDLAKFSQGAAKVGKTQCCSGKTNECVRKGAGVCFTGSNDTELYVTHPEALMTCDAVGMRLCTKEEVLSSESMSCCYAGCALNNFLVWTSTTMKASDMAAHEELKAQLQALKNKNVKLQSSLDNYGKVVSKIEDKIGIVATGYPLDGSLPVGGRGTASGTPVSYDRGGNFGSVSRRYLATAGVVGMNFPPLPGEEQQPSKPHAFTEDEAERIRAENTKLAEEKYSLDVANRNLKDHIIDAIASSVKSGDQVDPSTFPKHAFWPTIPPPSNDTNGTTDTVNDQVNASHYFAGHTRPVEMVLPDGSKVITDDPREAWMRRNVHDAFQTAEEADFANRQVFLHEVELTFQSLDDDKDQRLSWQNMADVISRMLYLRTVPDNLDLDALHSIFDQSATDKDGMLDQAGFQRFIEALGQRTGEGNQEFLTFFFEAADTRLAEVIKPCDNCTYIEKHPCDSCTNQHGHSEARFWKKIGSHAMHPCDNCKQVPVDANETVQ